MTELLAVLARFQPLPLAQLKNVIEWKEIILFYLKVKTFSGGITSKEVGEVRSNYHAPSR